MLKMLKKIFISRSPPKIPEVHVKEEHFLLIASALRNELNQAFVILRSIALGRDLKKFLMVCLYSTIVDVDIEKLLSSCLS